MKLITLMLLKLDTEKMLLIEIKKKNIDSILFKYWNLFSITNQEKLFYQCPKVLNLHYLIFPTDNNYFFIFIRLKK